MQQIYIGLSTQWSYNMFNYWRKEGIKKERFEERKTGGKNKENNLEYNSFHSTVVSQIIHIPSQCHYSWPANWKSWEGSSQCLMKVQPNICQEEQGKAIKYLRIVSALAQIWTGPLPTDVFSTTNAPISSVSMQIMALWIEMPCSFAVMCQHTEGTCCLHQA